jgi:hypothetical protein
MIRQASHRVARRFLLGLAVAALAGATLSSARAKDGDSSWFDQAFSGGNRVVGSGRLQTESRAPGSFQAISIKGPIRMVLRQGSREAIEVTADDNLLPLIETRVENAMLKVGPRKGISYSSRNPVTVTVDFVALKELAVGGSGDVVGQAMKASTLEVAIGGSGTVRLPKLQASTLSLTIGGSGDFESSGRTGRFSVGIGGSGSVHAEELDADDVSVNIGGSGDASVRANRTLDVSVGGSGDVVYSGAAVVKTSIAGSGSVRKR